MSSPKDMSQRRKNSSEAAVSRAREVWRQPFAGFSVFDVIHATGSPLDALLYAHVFWPTFVTLEDMVLLPFDIEDEADKQRVRDRFASCLDRVQVEEEFNCIEVASLFGRRRNETSAEEDEMLAQYLAETWAAKLKIDFPSKVFHVRLMGAVGDTEICVTFSQQR